MSTPIRLISLTLRNFMSYSNSPTTIDLEFKEPTLIIGRNLDAMVNGQVDSNGSGKTTIINALAWGLYGKPISKISQDGLVNNINKKDMEVTVVFEKDGTFYKILRHRKHSVYGDAGVKVFEAKTLDDILSAKEKSGKKKTEDKDKDKEKAESSIVLTNRQIERIIGMPYDIFTRIVIYSARHEPFFSLPATSAAGKTNQADIMEELTGLTDLSRKGDIINEEMKANNRELESLKKIQEEIDRQKAQFQEKIDGIKARIEQWDAVKGNNISATQAKIDKLSDIDFELQREYLKEYVVLKDKLKDCDNAVWFLDKEISTLNVTIDNAQSWEIEYNAKLVSAKKEIEDNSGIDFDEQETLLTTFSELQAQITKLTDEANAKGYTIVDQSKRMDAISTEVEHLADNKCPYCKQQFQNVQGKIDELELEKSKLYGEQVTLLKENKATAEVLSKLHWEKEDTQSQLKFKNLVELNRAKSVLTKAKDKLELLEGQTNPFAETDLEDAQSQKVSLTKDLTKAKATKEKLFKKQSLLEGEMLYRDETSLAADFHKIEALNTELKRLNDSENPHLETLKDMGTMKFDEDNYKKINELEDLVQHQKFLYKLLTHKNSFIRKSLLTKSIKFLNERLKDYLDMLGLPHKVRFTEELTASISQFGNILDYDNLSSGQQARVNLALSFAFRDVLQKRYGKISFCILDECLDVGLGGVGVQMAAKMIKNLAIKDKLSMFIISHRDEITNLFPKAMEIELDKGFSRIVKP